MERFKKHSGFNQQLRIEIPIEVFLRLEEEAKNRRISIAQVGREKIMKIDSSEELIEGLKAALREMRNGVKKKK